MPKVNAPMGLGKAPRAYRPPGELQSRSAATLAEHMLNQNAVKLGNAPGDVDGEGFPYFYSFVPFPYYITEGDSGGSPSRLPSPPMSGEGPDGLSVPAASATEPGIKDIPIRLDRDYNYDLLEIRYGVRCLEAAAPYGSYVDGKGGYLLGSNVGVSGDYDVTTGLAAAFQDGFIRYLSHPFKLPVPVYENVRVTAYMRSGFQRSLYGGESQLTRGGTDLLEEIPVPISNLQGYDDGKNSLRTPILLSREAVVIIRVRNYFPYAVNVNGCLFGYKVAY